MDRQAEYKGIERTKKEEMMKTYLGKAGLTKTWQSEFPETMDCKDCGGSARIAFVATENEAPKDEALVCDLYSNDPGGEGYWPHDAIAVAVYFCTKCLKSVSSFNQA